MKLATYLETIRQEIVTCRSSDTAQAAADQLKRAGIGAMPVMSDKGRLVGMISERDISHGFARHGSGLAGLMVADLLAKKVIFMGPNATMVDAMNTMHDYGFRHIPVMSSGKVIGVVSVRDAIAHVVGQSADSVPSGIPIGDCVGTDRSLTA